MQTTLVKTFFWAFLLSVFSSCALPKDTLLDTSTLQTCSSDAVDRFEFARNKTDGLIVSNPTNDNFGMIKADNEGPWKPANGQKKTVCGTYYSFLMWDPWGDEHDWNINMVPAEDFKFVIDDVRPLVQDVSEWKRFEINGRFSDGIQAEITPDESLYDNVWFPNLGHKDETKVVANPNICVFGPWVRDGNHGWRPEIHPCEVIWWRKQERGKDEYFIFGIQDDSNRFDESSDFEGTKPAGWKPWALPPITSQLKIPFEYSGQFTDHLVVNIEVLKARHIVTHTLSNAGDSDNGKNHILKFKRNFPEIASATLPSNILVEVNETQPLGTDIGVQFVEICRKPNGHIIGYIQLYTAFGAGISGQEGYHVLKVTLNHPTKKVPDIKAE